jgi:diaminopimelate decarboxylase
MKSCPNAAILRLLMGAGLHFDASSGYEALRAMKAGAPGSLISLSTQELPDFFPELVAQGVFVNACSLNQLERFGEKFPGAEVGVRFNPGSGSGANGKTNVGGPDSSFGIWHEDVAAVQAVAKRHSLKIVRIHTHIGSGSDPAVWQKTSLMTLGLAPHFPEVTTIDLGGGYKVARMSSEKGTDLRLCGAPVKAAFESFAASTGRRLKLEIEPGTFLVANTGAVISTITDIVSTGKTGRTFLKIDSGMTEVLRPSLYGSQHPAIILPKLPSEELKEYVIVGHCCESGDLVTCAPGEPETISPRILPKASIGDLLVLEGAGAYCSAMSAKNYNSFPEAPEVLVRADGSTRLIRRRQTLDQILANEI